MNREGLRELSAFFILALTAFLFVSLLSYDQADFYDVGATGYKNACGWAGAHLSHFFISWIGLWGSYLLLGAVAAISTYRFLRQEIQNLHWKLIGLVITILCLASLENALMPGGTVFPGGYYGHYFHTRLLANLSWFGTYLLIGSSLIIALIISTDLRFSQIVEKANTCASTAKGWGSAGLKAKDNLTSLLVKAKPTRVAWPRKTTEEEPEPLDLKPVKRNTKKSKASKVKEEVVPEEEEYEWEEEEAEDEDCEYEYVYEDEEEEEEPEEEDEEEYEYVYEDEEEEEYEEEEEVEEEAPPPKAKNKTKEPKKEKQKPEAKKEEAPKKAAPKKNEAPKPPPVTERKIDDSAPFEVNIREEEKVTKAPKTKTAAKPKRRGKYKLPPVDLINEPKYSFDPADRTVIQETARRIEETLKNFKIEAKVVEVQRGPVITQYEISLAAGIKVHKIVALADDMSMALEAESIRIVAPIPGKSTVGIEVPNASRNMVGLKELIQASEFREQNYGLPMALGKDIAGKPIVADLTEMPHLLIAGSTGSGKSVAINTVIINLLLTKTPEEVKVILVDPKMVELSLYEEIPHLLTPVVTDMKRAPAVLNWLVDKMEERYELLAKAGVRHLTAYNSLGREALNERLRTRMDEEDIADIPDFLPYIVIIIDELADLMMTASKEVEASITRLAQKSRAVGIHVILATQRPSVDVITGLIKANMPCRISFKVTSKVDSRTIMDRNGAEKLLGKGDMLYLPPGTSNIMRSQGAFISDKEIDDVVKFVRKEAAPQFDEELAKFGAEGGGGGSDEDELYDEAVRVILGQQRGSVTLLQRSLQIGYTRASRLMELMHDNGLVGPFKGSKAREVYYTIDEWEAARNSKSSK